MPLLLGYLAISGHKDLIPNTRAYLFFLQNRFQSLRGISILWGLLSPEGPAQLQWWKQKEQWRGLGWWNWGDDDEAPKTLQTIRIPVTDPVERPQVREKLVKNVAIINRPSCEAALEPVFTKIPHLCNYHLGRTFSFQTP